MITNVHRLTEHFNAVTRERERYKSAAEKNGTWITVGGAPAMVDAGGSIIAACPGLNGEDVEDLSDEEPESRQRRKVKQDVATSRGLDGNDLNPQQAHKLHNTLTAKQHAAATAAARQHGVKVPDILAAIPSAHSHHAEMHKAREAIKTSARQALGLNAGDLARMENQGLDYTSIPRFDEFAEEVLMEHPELGLHRDSDDASGAIWDLIREGKKAAPTKHSEDVVTMAAHQARPPSKVHPLTKAFDDAFSRGAAGRSRQSSPATTANDVWDTSDAEPDFQFFSRSRSRYSRLTVMLDRYAGKKKKPAAGQKGMNFDEDAHPRDDSGQFTAGGDESANAEAEQKSRTKRGQSKLSKEELAAALKTIRDVYVENKLEKVVKGEHRDSGDEILGYPHAPELFQTSSITGAKIRHYITLPDGRIAHPTELDPTTTQADIERALFDVRKQESDAKERADSRTARIATVKSDANYKFRATNRSLEGSYFMSHDDGRVVRVDGTEPDDAKHFESMGFKQSSEPVKADPMSSPEPHPLTQALDEAFQLTPAKAKGFKRAEFIGQEKKVTKPLFIGGDDLRGQSYLFGEPDDPLEDTQKYSRLTLLLDRYAARRKFVREDDGKFASTGGSKNADAESTKKPTTKTEKPSAKAEPAKSVTKSPEALHDKILSVASKLTEGEPHARRTNIAALRRELPGVPLAEIQSAMRDMEAAGKVVLYPFDDPREITAGDTAAAVKNGAGLDRHIFYVPKLEVRRPYVAPANVAEPAPAKLSTKITTPATAKHPLTAAFDDVIRLTDDSDDDVIHLTFDDDDEPSGPKQLTPDDPEFWTT